MKKYNVWSYQIIPRPEQKLTDDVDEEKLAAEQKNKQFTATIAGQGKFTLMFNKEVIHVVHKEIGPPVGTSHQAASRTLLVLFVKGQNHTQPIVDLMEYVASLFANDRVKKDMIAVYRFNPQYKYWAKFYEYRSRPEGSVVLPRDVKKKLFEDVAEFMKKDTKTWYFERGIPYKRSYLFYGVPGSGKTSIISVLAGKYKRPICYLSPTDPKMTDDILKGAVVAAPRRAIIVLEDVDGFFGKNRRSNMANHLTFSGLLNALDGVGSGLGQIFVLTTNYRNRLDSALIRNGRVDLQLEFKHVDATQVEEMFGLFYPNAPADARLEFRRRVFEEISKSKLFRSFNFINICFLVSSKPCLSAAMLQNFFITHRRCNYGEAIDQVEHLVEDVKNAISATEGDGNKDAHASSQSDSKPGEETRESANEDPALPQTFAPETTSKEDSAN